MAMKRFGRTIRGAGVERINPGHYALSGGQELRFRDDSSTVESVGCVTDDLIVVLLDRMGANVLKAKLGLMTPPEAIDAPIAEVVAVEAEPAKKKPAKKKQAKKKPAKKKSIKRPKSKF